MNIMSGTIRSNVCFALLNSKWMQKKDSGDVLSKQELNERANWTQDDWMVQNFEDQLEDNRESEYLAKITNKATAGRNLTSDEEQYLASKNPTALQNYKRTKQEKRDYEEKLRNCKTKDEVDRLKTETMGSYLASMKKVENDPVIPMSEKLAKAEELLAKTRLVVEAEREFKQSAEYTQLPTEAEESQARAEEREYEREEISEDIRENSDEYTRETDEDGAISEDIKDAEGSFRVTDEDSVEASEDAPSVNTRGKDVSSKEIEHDKQKPKKKHKEDDPADEIESIFRKIEISVTGHAEGGSGRRINYLA